MGNYGGHWPEDLDRQIAKRALIQRLAEQNLLASEYFGPAPELVAGANLEIWLVEAINEILLA